MSVKDKKNSNGKKKDKKPVKCFDCGGPHFRNKCNKKNEQSECVLYCDIAQAEFSAYNSNGAESNVFTVRWPLRAKVISAWSTAGRQNTCHT